MVAVVMPPATDLPVHIVHFPVVGLDQLTLISSDPLVNMIKKEGLSNLIVVVTRYFGGILLGTGGLVHAYSKSAKLGVEAAKPVTMQLCREVMLECDYSMFGKLQPWILNQGLKISDINYADNVGLCVFVPVAAVKSFVDELIDMTNGKIKISQGEEGYSVQE